VLPRRLKGSTSAPRMDSTPVEKWFVIIILPSSLWGSVNAPKANVGERSPSKPLFKRSFQVVRVSLFQLIIIPPPNQVSKVF
jgi:hypothetical protein